MFQIATNTATWLVPPTMGLQLRPALAPASEVPATTMQDGDRSRWEQLADKYWLKSAPTKVKGDVIKAAIWDPLEADAFSSHAVVPLESLQILEKFLWPTFSEAASNHHVLLIAIFVNLKQRGHLLTWSLFEDRRSDFSHLFRRVLSLNLDRTLSTTSRLALLNFVIAAFQALDKDIVRKECGPLVSISIWHNLQNDTVREKYVQSSKARRNAWKKAQEQFSNADSDTQAKLRFNRAWLCSMIADFISRMHTPAPLGSQDLTYCEKFLEFVIDLESQVPTRRYTDVLVKDLNLPSLIRCSEVYKKPENALLRDLTSLLHHFQSFVVEESASPSTQSSQQSTHYASLAHLQRISLKHFDHKLKVLALSNYASVEQRSELESHFSLLSDDELKRLCDLLLFRTEYPTTAGVTAGRELYLEVLLSAYARPQNFQEAVSRLSVLPTEETLYDDALLRSESYDGTRPLALPKLNLQYLNMTDFMWRSFQLHQAEAFYAIRKDMESIVRRMKPRAVREPGATIFEGFSKMAMPIDKPAIIEVAPPKVGAVVPGYVRAEVILEVSRLNDSLRREWDSLRPKDVVFLLCIKALEGSSRMLTNGHGKEGGKGNDIIGLRAAEVVQVMDDSGRALRDMQNTNGFVPRPKRRRLLIDIDPSAYYTDKERMAKGKPDIYPSFNVIARRQGRENNFRPVLETMQKLVNAQTELPYWLQEPFLGDGYNHPPAKVENMDFLDTFLDWQHLEESFPNRTIKSTSEASPTLEPPYVLRVSSEQRIMAPSKSRKRNRAQMEDDTPTLGPVQISTYKPRNTGPYPVDARKKNTVRFTPKQTEAIVLGTQPGLSIIVGPPGTGKTDVATQIINLLYHNFPQERILLVAHSNQALNQLFQKIIALDIDARHLLRLGHGEEELDADVSYSKYGRVESFLENRQVYLAEVTRLAGSLRAEGAHGSSCETADYFNQVFVKPTWARFWDTAKANEATPEAVVQAFPFHRYFGNAPIPALFPPKANMQEVQEIASGCQYHIDKTFSELEAIRPFEILRHGRDQANHLLVKEARIVAMTSTHAAMRRSEIADLGFHYDTLVMEEAAQINEVESFIPCAMQNPESATGELPLKRVVLVGDHLQNSPIVSNLALKEYSNFEQSLFQRLVRLGVPSTSLDQQGRCRPSIADLFKWRYNNLGNLPHLTGLPEFARANAGFRYDYQFIDVPDYQGQGEREPTPHFIQNLGEAEYAVALFQYMRLLGYPARSISILAAYAGQRALIRDVLEHRCKENKLFGLPKIVTTVDKYQGEQNDYVILSMTRTRGVGYLRDVRRLTVALSRARLGLYILGRRELFETCFEMKPAMDLLVRRPAKLVLTTGEMFPAQRQVEDEATGVEMEGVEHLGQYVYEMTQAKVKALGGQVMVPAGMADAENGYTADDGLDGELLYDVHEEDPLHESV